MNYIFEDVGNHQKEYPDSNSAEVQSRMLPLPKYLELARRTISTFAPQHIKSRMLSSDDAISFVAFYIMRGDWDYDESKGTKITTYRCMNGKYGITAYIDTIAHQPVIMSLDAERSNGKALKEVLIDKKAVEPDVDNVDSTKKRRYVHNLLGLLTPIERECVELRYWLGLDSQETANTLGINRQRVQYALTSAMKRMRIFAGIENVKT